MKVTIEFNLPEDDSDFEASTKGSDLALTLWDLQRWLRENYKYGTGDITIEAAEKVSEKLSDIMLSYGLTFDSKIFL